MAQNRSFRIYCDDRNIISSSPRHLVLPHFFHPSSYSVRREDAALSHIPFPPLQCNSTRSPTPCVGRLFQDYHPPVLRMEYPSYFPRSSNPGASRVDFPPDSSSRSRYLTTNPVRSKFHACSQQHRSAFVRTSGGFLHCQYCCAARRFFGDVELPCMNFPLTCVFFSKLWIRYTSCWLMSPTELMMRDSQRS